MHADADVPNAIADLGQALDADGFELFVEKGYDQSRVRVVLRAKPDACLDCLVPDDILTAIVSDSIHKVAGYAEAHVRLLKVGFDAIDPAGKQHPSAG